jgi:hypothetical protein
MRKEKKNGEAVWRLASGDSLHGGKKNDERKNLRPGTPFIGERQRDGSAPGPHVGDDEPATRGLAEPWHGASSPVPGQSCMARSVFKNRPRPLYHRAGPNSLDKHFLISNLLGYAKYQNDHS